MFFMNIVLTSSLIIEHVKYKYSFESRTGPELESSVCQNNKQINNAASPQRFLKNKLE